MNNSQKNPKLNFDQILLKLEEMHQRDTVPEKMDYFTLLEEMSAFYNLTAEELETRGFRKAYRQAVEGL